MIPGISSFSLLILSAIFLVPVLILLSLPTAIFAVKPGSKSRKGNSNKKGKIGVITGSISLIVIAIVIAAVILVALGGQIVTIDF